MLLNHSCTTPLPTNGIGNITGPPLFMDMAAGDFRLREDSPCIDAAAIAEQEAWYARREVRRAGARKLIETLGEEAARPIIEAEKAEAEVKELARWANAPMVENPYLTPEQRAYWDKVNARQTEA